MRRRRMTPTFFRTPSVPLVRNVFPPPAGWIHQSHKRNLLIPLVWTLLLWAASMSLNSPPVLAQEPPAYSFQSSIGTDIDTYHKITLADLNWDGYVDIVAIGNEWSGNQIFLNDGSGGFDFGTQFGINIGAADAVIEDVDGDGYLDIITGGEYVYDDLFCLCYIPTENWIYLNDGMGNFSVEPEFAYAYGVGTPAVSIAVGDIDGDGHVDIVAEGTVAEGTVAEGTVAEGNFDEGSVCDCTADGQCSCTTRVANAPNVIYFNDGSGDFSARGPVAYGSGRDELSGIALGDFNGNGYVDILSSHSSLGYVRFDNDGAGNFPTLQQVVQAESIGAAFEIGDLDNDDDLDLITHIVSEYDEACLCYLGQHMIYLNDGTGSFAAPYPVGSPADYTAALELGDVNGDGYIDLVVSTTRFDADLIEERANALYLNDGLGGFAEYSLSLISGDNLSEPYFNHFVLDDIDSDGDLDLITTQSAYPGVYEGAIGIYINETNERVKPDEPSPFPDLYGIFDISPQPNTDSLSREPSVIITYSLSSTLENPIDQIGPCYSLDDGDSWILAKPTQNTPTTNLVSGTYRFEWDVSQLGYYGRKENALVRFHGWHSPQALPECALLTVATEPLGVGIQATQIRVTDEENQGLSGAIVYRLPANQVSAGVPLMNAQGMAYRTDDKGYLRGWDRLTIDKEPTLADKLVALRPITVTEQVTFTDKVRFFETSAPVDDTSLVMHPANQHDEIVLQVSEERILALFDLDVSLEWDARLDGTFQADLALAFKRASEVLYDVTNGQVALRNIRVYTNKERWANADIVIYANSNLRPRATMGGIVNGSHSDKIIGKDNKVRTVQDVYGPGQIRMGPVWDPFGQSEAELSQDWWRALAHELAHYLLFLPDNYLGIQNGAIRTTDCFGSFMTNAYDVNDYSEFLTDDGGMWKDDCKSTIAEKLTGRADWATIKAFYPKLLPPAKALAGPHILPLDLTHVHFEAAQETVSAATSEEATAAPTLIPARFFDLRSQEQQLLNLAQSQAYLYKTNGTFKDDTDDYVITLGSTGVGSDRIKVRGAETGDRLCVLSNDQRFVGCDSSLAENDTSIRVNETKDWQPNINVSHVSSTTLAVTVTNDLPRALTEMAIQILPSQSAEAEAFVVTSPKKIVPVTGDTFSASFTLPNPTFEGFVRVCGPCIGDIGVADQDARESLTQFYLSPAWGPEDRGLSGGANRRDWQANRRSFEAPIASGDGKVTILNVDDILADTGTSSLQALSNLPGVDEWLTPVGPGYRFAATRNVAATPTITRTIAFQYLQREVPPGYEHTLNIYYLPEGNHLADGKKRWQRLSTGPTDSGVDARDNLATALMPQEGGGEGIYALMATVEMPALTQGWNILSMPLPGEHKVTEALTSLGQDYSIVYQYNPEHDPETEQKWRVYDPSLEALEEDDAWITLLAVNDLKTMEFGHDYWIHTSDVVTPYLSIPKPNGEQAVQAADFSNVLGLPPAVVLGRIERDNLAALAAGDTVTAEINGQACGRGTLIQEEDMLIYKVLVASRMETEGCGVMGDQVIVRVGELMVAKFSWDNQQSLVLDPGGRVGIPTDLPLDSEPNSGTIQPAIFIPLLQN